VLATSSPHARTAPLRIRAHNQNGEAVPYTFFLDEEEVGDSLQATLTSKVRA